MASSSNARNRDVTAGGGAKFPKEKSGAGGEQSAEKKRHGVSDNAIQDVEQALRQGVIVSPTSYEDYALMCSARGRTAMPPISAKSGGQGRRVVRSRDRSLIAQENNAVYDRIRAFNEREQTGSIADIMIPTAISNDTKTKFSDKAVLPKADDKAISSPSTMCATGDAPEQAPTGDSFVVRPLETSWTRQPESIWDKWVIQFALGWVGVETIVFYYACYLKAFGVEDIFELSVLALFVYLIACLSGEKTDIAQQRIARFLVGLAKVQAIVLFFVAIAWLNSWDSPGNIFFSILVGWNHHGTIWQNGYGDAVNIFVASFVAWFCFGIGFIVGDSS